MIVGLYYIRCHGDSVPGHCCGLVELTHEQYMAQLSRPDRGWACPNCGSSASFDDARFEAGIDALDKFMAELQA